MLEKYIDWDQAVVRLLKEIGQKQCTLQNLNEEYHLLLQDIVTAPQGRHGDEEALMEKAIYRCSLLDRMFAIQEEQRILSRAFAALSPEERTVLIECYQKKHRSAQEAIDTLCDCLGYERATIYRLRTSALRRLKELLAG